MFVLLQRYVEIFDTARRSVTAVVHKLIRLSVFIHLFLFYVSVVSWFHRCPSDWGKKANSDGASARQRF